MIDDDKFGAIISDYDMPEMDGLEFFKVLKEQGKDIFFIVFTESGQEGLENKAEEKASQTKKEKITLDFIKNLRKQ